MPVQRLRGVWQDGSATESERLAQNPRKTVSVIQGSSFTVKLEAYRESGEPVDLPSLSGVSLELTVKRPGDAGVAGSAETIGVTGTLMTSEGAHRADFSITPTQTRLLDPGIYVYDIWLITDNEREPLIPTSTLHLEPSVGL